MKLLQIKIRGLGSTPSTDWFSLTPHLNMFMGQNVSYRSNILAALETINPPFSCSKKKPFSDFPLEIQQNGYAKRISPHKRTISLGVFAATPQLVVDLGQISESLYETDRIEVGRRLNYTRWLNFVELRSSARWGEVSENFRILADILRPTSPERVNELSKYIDELTPGDRIKRTLMNQLATWLSGLPTLPEDLNSTAELTHSAVLRAEHFHKARRYVYQRLPLMAMINSSDSLATQLSFIAQIAHEAEEQNLGTKNSLIKQLNEQLASQKSEQADFVLHQSAGHYVLADKNSQSTTAGVSTNLNQLKASVELASAISIVSYKTQPILLFPEPDRYIPKKDHPDLIQFLFACAEKRQCLCSLYNTDLLEKVSPAISSLEEKKLHYIQLDQA